MSEAAPPAWLDYQLRGAGGQMRPGRHPDRQAGIGGAFRGVQPFWQAPDARRLDLRRSLMEPSGALMVRQTDHAASLTLLVAIDLSASMRPRPDGAALDHALTIAEAAARSALHAGDAFGLLGFDQTVHPFLPPSRSRGAIAAALHALAAAGGAGRSAQGLAALAAHLPPRRCLLLLLSDFALPADRLDTALAALSRHDVAPILIRRDLAAHLARTGLMRLRAPETGQTRLVLMRPGLRRAWQRAEAGRLAALQTLFVRHGRPGFCCDGPPDLAALSLHLSTA